LITDLDKAIAELREEFERIQEALAALERLAAGGRKRRGRPPKWLSRVRSSESSGSSRGSVKKKAVKTAVAEASPGLPPVAQ
jgi:hypothetical protein